MPFLISSIVRTTQNTVVFIWVYIIVRPTQKTGGPLWCYQHRVLAFIIWDYIIVRPTKRTGMPFGGFWLILLCDQHRKLACLFDFFYCSNNTKYCHFYLSLYYCAINTENWRAFFSMIFILLCYQHKVLTFFIWEYIIVRPTQKTGVPFWFWFILLCDKRKKLACILCVRWNWHVLARKMIVIFHILSRRPTAIWRFDNAQWQLFLALPTKQNTDMWAVYNNWCVDNVRG